MSSGSDGRGCPESLETDPDDVQDAKPSQGDLLRPPPPPGLVSHKHELLLSAHFLPSEFTRCLGQHMVPLNKPGVLVNEE